MFHVKLHSAWLYHTHTRHTGEYTETPAAKEYVQLENKLTKLVTQKVSTGYFGGSTSGYAFNDTDDNDT